MRIMSYFVYCINTRKTIYAHTYVTFMFKVNVLIINYLNSILLFLS